MVGEYRGTLTIFPFPCRDGVPYEVSELTHCTQRLTDVKISFDDTFLVTASVDGVFQWRVLDPSRDTDAVGSGSSSQVERVESYQLDRKEAVKAANEAWGTDKHEGNNDAREGSIDSRLLDNDSD